MKKILQGLLVLVTLFLSWIHTRNSMGPLTEADVEFYRQVGICIGNIFHIGFYYLLPVLLLNKLYWKFIASAPSKHEPDCQ